MKRLCWLMIPVLLCAAGCSQKAEKSLFAMDTYCTIEAYGASAEAAVTAAGEELTRLDRLLSITGTESDVARFNRSAQSDAEVSKETAALLLYAREISARTGGAFDVTIEPVVALWGFYGDVQRVPEQAELDAALPLVGASKLTVTETHVSGLPGQGIDLGGIAKGYASNRVAERLAACGVTGALISLGGNVQAVGRKPDGSAWRIGVRDPMDENGVVGVVEARDKAVVTAGSYQRYFLCDGVRYHHIIDPATGRPAESGLVSATVLCGDGAYADALSTALFVMGTERAIAYWRANRDFEMILIDAQQCVYATESAGFTLLADGYKLAKIRE